MSAIEFEVIEKPENLNELEHRGRTVSPLTQAVIDTVDTDNVVKVNLAGKKVVNVSNAIIQTAKRRGFTVRRRRLTEDTLVYWAERIAPLIPAVAASPKITQSQVPMLKKAGKK